MDFYMKLPRNKKEFALFVGIISILSVNIIAPLITCFETGFHLYVWADVLRVLPFIWLSVIALVLLTYLPAEKMTAKIVAEGDSFRAHIAVNILCTVLLMSIFLTVIGTWIGTRSVTMEPLKTFFTSGREILRSPCLWRCVSRSPSPGSLSYGCTGPETGRNSRRWGKRRTVEKRALPAIFLHFWMVGG